MEETKAYLEAFQYFDRSNKGVISNKSLLKALRRAGLNPTEVGSKLFYEYFSVFMT